MFGFDNTTSNVLNDKNKHITKHFVNNLLKEHNVITKINNIAVFQTAMTHESYVIQHPKNVDFMGDEDNDNDLIPLQNQSYDRLEFLGDSVLHVILTEYLFERYPNENEDFLTNLRIKIENGHTLAKISKEIKLNKYVLISKFLETSGNRQTSEKICEDIFESFIGALFIDSKKNYSVCKQFIINIIETHIDITQMISSDTNYKMLLMQAFHKKEWPAPIYNMTKCVENGNKKIFTIEVRDPSNNLVGKACGAPKKSVEQKAAYNGLITMGLLQDDESDEEIYEIND